MQNLTRANEGDEVSVWERAGARMWDALPHGTPLPDADWARRHGTISTLALLHAPVVLAYALLVGFGPVHAVLETLPVAVTAVAGRRPGSARLPRELFTTLSLVSSSAVLVHLSGGFIELHFHFFVVVALVTLYQQWTPFLVAIVFVLLHHGIAGATDPMSVYNHPSAITHPWRWAAIHAGFIAAASAVGLANWKLNELARQRAEASFRQLYEGEHALVQRLEETDRVKSELVAAVSHEFRTPLTAILGLSQTLDRNALPPERASDVAARIYRQGRRLQHLIENILEADSPLDAFGGDTDAEEMIDRSVRSTLAAARDSDREVEVECPDGLRLHLNPDAAQQVLTNLLGNAVKFATAGTPITVRAHTSSRGGTRIEVANHGPEVPPDQRERIFEPFVQGDQSDTRAADGVGLGLHVVHRVVTATGGDIAISCEEGITTFSVWIPAPIVRAEPALPGQATATVA